MKTSVISALGMWFKSRAIEVIAKGRIQGESIAVNTYDGHLISEATLDVRPPTKQVSWSIEG